VRFPKNLEGFICLSRVRADAIDVMVERMCLLTFPISNYILMSYAIQRWEGAYPFPIISHTVSWIVVHNSSIVLFASILPSCQRKRCSVSAYDHDDKAA
jgi:hypothetical protein